MSREYTLTEALQELKLLTKRISSTINDTQFCGALRSEDIKNKDFICKDTVSNYQSINDLITRRAKIKSAIMQANAVTSVEIAGKVYTIAEAISTKEYINDKQNLLERMINTRATTSNAINSYNNDRQRKIDALITSSFGRDSSQRNNAEDISTITDMYMKKNYVEFVDPLKIDDRIKELEKEIDEFKHQVDYKLSYINAITKITV
jgi:hypothetical protein